MSDAEWIGLGEAARILGVHRQTVLRSLRDPAAADAHWGSGNWRRKPLSPRGDFQVRPDRARELAEQAQSAPESG